MLIWRIFRARWHLAAAGALGFAAFGLMPATLAPLARCIFAWDVGCAGFLALVAVMFVWPEEGKMARRAARQQEGEWTVFVITLGGVLASTAVLVAGFPAGDAQRVPAVGATLLLSWLTMHTLFALRYAHEFYTHTQPDAPDGGLIFPGEPAPDYWDFMYFALVLGMTFQVSDVQITGRKLRRLATAHGVLAFIFNTALVALSVNLAAGLISAP
jgi:uncharacterized membrane protein